MRTVTCALTALAVAITVLLVAACADGNGAQQPETVVPSIAATATATPPPARTTTPYPAPQFTPLAHRSGPAHELGRDDCPYDWRAWVSDPTGFSICYPQSWEEHSSFRPWDEGTTITLPQAGLPGAAQVSILYLTTIVEYTWSECDDPETVTMLGRPATLCVSRNQQVAISEHSYPPVIEAWGYYIPYDHAKLAVGVILWAQMRPDAGPECFPTPPPGYVGEALLPPEHCVEGTYDPEVKATAFRILETLRAP